MPVNLELKIKTESHRNILHKLRLINAEEKKTLVQKDIYFKVSNGLLKLRIENGNYFLIKYLRDEKRKRWSNYEILELKGKNPEKYLADIFQTEVIVEKKRRLFIYKDTRIHIDKVKGLGLFLELETVVTKNKKYAEKQFIEVINFLGLDLSSQIRKSYKNLLMK